MMFRFWSSTLVRHLEDEIAWLRLERQKETQRANDAVAELVRLSTAGQANVQAHPLIADREQDLAKELTELQKDGEWSQVGT
jgi:monomeric isocitrate dehydrogenase